MFNNQLPTTNNHLSIINNHLPFGTLYIRREPSTNQPIFMQNKPNFLDDQMNVTYLITADYENKSNWKLGKNKPNTKPIKANLLHPQMNVASVITKYYSNEQRTMNNERLCKTNPIKPNFKGKKMLLRWE